MVSEVSFLMQHQMTVFQCGVRGQFCNVVPDEFCNVVSDDCYLMWCQKSVF